MDTWFVELFQEMEFDGLGRVFAMAPNTEDQHLRVNRLQIMYNELNGMELGQEYWRITRFNNAIFAESEKYHPDHQYYGADLALMEELLKDKLTQMAPIGWSFGLFSVHIKAQPRGYRSNRWWGFAYGLQKEEYWHGYRYRYLSKNRIGIFG